MSGRKIDINKASVDELSTLIGVGRAKAEAIFDARKVKGGFKSINELKDVSGIGPSILEQNQGLVYCGRSYAKAKVLDRESTVMGHNTCDSYSLRDRAETSAGSEVYCLRDREPVKKTACPGKCLGSSTKEIKAENEIHDNSKPSSSYNSFRQYRTPSDGEESSVETCSGTRLVKEEVVDSHNASAKDESSSSGVGGGNGQRAFDLLSDSESSSSSSQDDCDSSSLDTEANRLSVCGSLMKKKLGSVREDNSRESPISFGVVAALRSRSSLTLADKAVMKRKSDGGGSKDGSPEKKPCRSSSEPVSHASGTSPVSSAQATSIKPEKSINSHPLLRKGRIPSKANPPPELANWLKTFQEWSHPERLMALDELVELCEPTQVRHVMAVIEPQFQRDFISLLPKELALYVLSYLEPKDLCRAAQTCRYWRMLAEDNLLWREKCKEESIDESLVYENRPRKRSGCSSRSPWKTMYLHQKQIEYNWRQGPIRPPKVLKGHDDHVITCLEFSGTKIVSGSDDNTLKVWSALSGKCLRTLVGHTGGVWSSQMRDNIIISGSTDRTLKVWNADTGQCVHTLYGHTSTVRCMCLYQNRVVSGSRDATLRLWEVDTGHCLHVLMGHVAAVRCVQYDGRRVVSGAYDYMVKVWDPDTETCIHTLQGHTNRVYSLQFDGAHIVSGSLDTSIRVWDVETGQCLHTLIGHQSLTSGMQLKDNTLVSGNADSTVKVWDIKTGQCLQTLQGPNKHQSAVTCLQFSKKFVITSSDDGTVKVWSLKTGDFLRNLVSLDSGGSGGVVWRIRCSNTKLVCAVGSRNGTEETKLLVLDFDAEENGTSTNISSNSSSSNGGNGITTLVNSPGSNSVAATTSSGVVRHSSVST